ncbi:MAG TPA: hypothetical protein ENG51_14705 [Deltaproteobacteria bacterium]|nr:MAG: hypothetical protein DRG83_13695 [Deltaproteobacteria bacterium]RLB07369.1 MAG: hypothetical protein DRG59_06500 [Deltaproteobacteria bacterium]HDM77698.1 hypothetical protein [Deltaproteobacteria bacterium]HEC31702.1 hypothetical protein [Deltaproteobacteria bacterium]
MLTRKIVDLVQNNATELSKAIVKQILNHPTTKSYRNIDENALFQMIYDICSRFSYWLAEDNERGEVKEHYRNLGKHRFEQGISLPEVISALYLTKRKLWEFISADRDVNSSLDLNQILETSFLLVRFFDHAVLHVTEGFEEKLKEKYGYEAPLKDPKRFAEAMAEKEKKMEVMKEEPKLPELCFTKGMIRLEG